MTKKITKEDVCNIRRSNVVRSIKNGGDIQTILTNHFCEKLYKAVES